jgi:DNA-binding beta-propeller fold protein YncE
MNDHRFARLRILAMLACACALPAAAQNELFTANAGANSVTVHHRTDSGPALPVRTLVGAATGISFPQGLVLDPTHSELYVAIGSGPRINVYPIDAKDNAAPIRSLTGALTGMSQPVSIAVDPVHDEIFVANGNQTITVYNRADTGNVAPIRTINTTVAANTPISIAIDLIHDELIVGSSGSTVDVYARTAGGPNPTPVAPLRSLGGVATGLAAPIALAIDLVNDELFVTSSTISPPPAINVYHRTDSGNTAPIRTLTGAATGLVGPHALALDLANNELYVANTITANTITVYPRDASGNAVPSRTLGGAGTGISGPVGIAVTVGAPPGPAVLAGAASRKVHGLAGTFDLSLALTPLNPTTEPRQGTSHSIVLTFDKAITGGSAAISEGTAIAGTPTFSGNDMIVPLTGVADQQYVTVAATNVTSSDGGTGGAGSVRVGFLLGDVSQNRVVTLSDLGQVNAQIAQFVTGANFLKDVNVSGTLSLADKGITNAQLTRALPLP